MIQPHCEDRHPNKHKDVHQWNNSWEGELERVYAEGSSTFKGMENDKLDLLRQAAIKLHMPVVLRTKEVARAQRDLNNAFIEVSARTDVKKAWRASPQSRREEIALEGLFQASCVPALDDERFWCPEMAVRILAGNNNSDFINLLTRFFTPRKKVSDALVKPIIVKSKKFESLFVMPKSLNEDDPLHIMVEYFRLGRCFYITATVWYMFKIFCGGKEQIQRLYASRKQLTAVELQAASKVKHFRYCAHHEQHAASKDVIDDEPAVCEHCNKYPESEVALRDLRLQACPRCQCVGRNIWYCSTECQTVDWEKGFPVPHKNICGQGLILDPHKPVNKHASLPTLPDLAALDSEDDSKDEKNGECQVNGGYGTDIHIDGRGYGFRNYQMIPAPASGVKLSSSLELQIIYLLGGWYCNYWLFTRPSGPHIGVRIPQEERVVFYAHRYRAFKAGNKKSVEAMYKILLPLALEVNFPNLAAQLEDEYGISLAILGRSGGGNSRRVVCETVPDEEDPIPSISKDSLGLEEFTLEERKAARYSMEFDRKQTNQDKDRFFLRCYPIEFLGDVTFAKEINWTSTKTILESNVAPEAVQSLIYPPVSA